MKAAFKIDAPLVERYVLELARHGAHSQTGVSRPVYSSEWVAAQEQVMMWCSEAGLAVRRDAVGNVWARLEGTQQERAIVTGSHIDSQTPGGRYDGALGVVAALIAIRTLKEHFGTPKVPLEALSICEEEETRFHANFWGSRAIAGQIRDGEVNTIRESNGFSIGDAMRSVGLDPVRIREAARTDIEAFLELHIEQGPRLEDSNLSVGIVNAITGLRHYVVTITGRADHAGARPMSSRLDPMAGAAEIISGVIDEAIRIGPPAVTTVGTMAVEPNLTSAVPDRVTFTIDARHPDPKSLAQLYKHHESKIVSVAERRGLKASWTIELDRPPCQCDPELVSLLERTARGQGVPFLTMHSGAGHDSQQMAEVAKVVMIFVRSVGGRSHTPAEFTTVDDAVAGITLLAGALYELAY